MYALFWCSKERCKEIRTYAENNDSIIYVTFEDYSTFGGDCIKVSGDICDVMKYIGYAAQLGEFRLLSVRSN
ncbi:MAG: hypothetical protein PHC28_07870 [Flavobacterium sp.]|uniref:hypothetical protein n=1 Tax=Flavobacterium sp. TaxID=239 RepID=UPI002636880D|nr:hypothetical protein [Flavobacterium sp.]MDD5150389.1 hypothetical protein [Flavobacterium sp.]